MGELQQFSKTVAQSKMVPKKYRGRPQDIVVAVMHGMELGLPPLQALQSVAVINGRPSIYGDAALAVVRQSGLLADIEETTQGGGDGMTAYCRVKRADTGEEIEQRFSWAEAEQAGLTSKGGPWQDYPRRMLQMRARSWCLRDAFPEVLKGMMLAEEAEAIPASNGESLDPRGEMSRPKPDAWYQEAIDWMVGKAAAIADSSGGDADPWDELTEHADRIPSSDHPLSDWPDSMWEEAKERVRQAQADREDEPAEGKPAEGEPVSSGKEVRNGSAEKGPEDSAGSDSSYDEYVRDIDRWLDSRPLYSEDEDVVTLQEALPVVQEKISDWPEDAKKRAMAVVLPYSACWQIHHHGREALGDLKDWARQKGEELSESAVEAAISVLEEEAAELAPSTGEEAVDAMQTGQTALDASEDDNELSDDTPLPQTVPGFGKVRDSGIRTVQQLRTSAQAGTLTDIDGIGEKTAADIRNWLEQNAAQ